MTRTGLGEIQVKTGFTLEKRSTRSFMILGDNHRGWSQGVVTAAVHRVWSQLLVTGGGHRGWSQVLVTATGHSKWHYSLASSETTQNTKKSDY